MLFDMHDLDQDVVIVGAGPAGLSAAQMLGRARRRTLVLDSDSPRNRFAEHMHAVVGFDGTSPAELRRRGREEAERYGVTILESEIVGLVPSAALVGAAEFYLQLERFSGAQILENKLRV